MTAPAEQPEHPFEELTDSQKIDLILRQTQWLTDTVSGLLQHPMTRMMMGRKTR